MPNDLEKTDPARTAVTERGEASRDHAFLSAFVPGLGQLLQKRFVSAAVQFGTVATYVVGAATLGGGRALLLALLWNVWSVIDAYRHNTD